MKKTIDAAFNYWEDAYGIFDGLSDLTGVTLPWANDPVSDTILDTIYLGNHSGEKFVAPIVDRILGSDDTLSEAKIKSLASMLWGLYSVKWTKLHNVLSAQYNPIENYSMTEVTTPGVTTTKSRTEEKDVKEAVGTNIKTSHATDIDTEIDNNMQTDVYGFNSASAVPSSKVHGSASDNKQNVSGTAAANYDETIGTENNNFRHITADADDNIITDTETHTGYDTLERTGNIGVTTSQQMIESEIALWQWNYFEQVFADIDSLLALAIY